MKRIVRRLLRKLGFEVHYVGRASSYVAQPPPAAISVSPYVENPESGTVDFAEKLAREARGEPFEWPNIVAVNRAVVTLLGDATRIAELGGGTGCFAFEAGADLSRMIVCSELDADASRWARAHRARPNITYLNRALTRTDGPFDVVVAVEVVEHIEGYVEFLRACVELSPRAILTTPNRARGPRFDIPGPPETKKHVREWTAGEFYWVLRAFYRDVKLYGMPNPYVPELVPIRVTDTLSPLVADCRMPQGFPVLL
jgi:hypothetical protein